MFDQYAGPTWPLAARQNVCQAPCRMSDEEVFDCRACGACCRDASDGRVSVSTEDIVRWKRTGRNDIVDGLVEGHFSTMAFPSRPDGSCVHLGDGDRENDCSIYEIRGHICHLLEPGSEQCRAYRRTDAKFRARSSDPKA